MQHPTHFCPAAALIMPCGIVMPLELADTLTAVPHSGARPPQERFTVRSILIILGLWLVSTGQALAEARIALVIGNSNYTVVSTLPNPVNDAALMAQTLSDVGFSVTLVSDGDLNAMRAAVSAFGAALRDGGPDATGLFYYAGHGVQSFGRNYLLPVDAALSNAADLSLVGIEADSVLRQMFSARNRTNIVILDACRNNPFVQIPDLNDNGLAEMNAPTGTFLALATAPGAVALDGLGANSPFTMALATQMLIPGQPIEQVFKDVRVLVLEETRGLQTPWDTSSLTSDFVFRPEAVMSPEALAEAQLWASVRATNDPVQLMLFLRAYPDSSFETEARALLDQVMAAETADGATVEPGIDPAETAAFETATELATLAGYESFVQQYPNSVFLEVARAEIDTLKAAAAAAPPVPEGDPAAAALAADLAAQVVTFTAPLTLGNEAIIGQSIEHLITTTPMFPPIEGLPEEVWKNQRCDSCHQWTQEALCTQATTYLGQNAQRSLDLEHPLGNAFKLTLRAWAAAGCQ